MLIRILCLVFASKAWAQAMWQNLELAQLKNKASLYQIPALAGQKLMTLDEGQVVRILKRPDQVPGWTFVKNQKLEAWIQSSALEDAQSIQTLRDYKIIRSSKNVKAPNEAVLPSEDIQKALEDKLSK